MSEILCISLTEVMFCPSNMIAHVLLAHHPYFWKFVSVSAPRAAVATI